ncbi:MAG: tRNA (N6-threonylcarbamoyladenosine(37)-N6)-methyltransferase TrmO [Proteobacteria bacterium]|nr:tRNA (N6-threonylcarbamoyladenosine(37)-N6)-methyltransferase TrmO [Pseudomonadota bacterium]
MTVEVKAIGYVRTDAKTVPRHWSVSDVQGDLDILPDYAAGLKDITVGESIVVLFHFHLSPEFRSDNMFQTPPNRQEPRGVFSICSPIRPNPIGMSVVTVLAKQGGRIRVQGIDMINGTPILDIKPLITDHRDCPSSMPSDN